jgi:hypothetical protein
MTIEPTPGTEINLSQLTEMFSQLVDLVTDLANRIAEIEAR